jgi:hypothetical protein
MAAAEVPADEVVAAIGFQIVPHSTYLAYRAAFAPEQVPAVALQRLIDDRILAIEARRYAIAPDAGEPGMVGRMISLAVQPM